MHDAIQCSDRMDRRIQAQAWPRAGQALPPLATHRMYVSISSMYSGRPDSSEATNDFSTTLYKAAQQDPELLCKED